jgi:hypothetical protein
LKKKRNIKTINKKQKPIDLRHLTGPIDPGYSAYCDKLVKLYEKYAIPMPHFSSASQKPLRAELLLKPVSNDCDEFYDNMYKAYNKYSIPFSTFSESNNIKKYPVTDDEILNSDIGTLTEAEVKAQPYLLPDRIMPKEIEDELLRTLEVRKERNRRWSEKQVTTKLDENIIWKILRKHGFKD